MDIHREIAVEMEKQTLLTDLVILKADMAILKLEKLEGERRELEYMRVIKYMADAMFMGVSKEEIISNVSNMVEKIK